MRRAATHKEDVHDKMAGVSERQISPVPNFLQATYEDCKK
jgi:hypothetical protein